MVPVSKLLSKTLEEGRKFAPHSNRHKDISTFEFEVTYNSCNQCSMPSCGVRNPFRDELERTLEKYRKKNLTFTTDSVSISVSKTNPNRGDFHWIVCPNMWFSLELTWSMKSERSRRRPIGEPLEFLTWKSRYSEDKKNISRQSICKDFHRWDSSPITSKKGHRISHSWKRPTQRLHGFSRKNSTSENFHYPLQKKKKKNPFPNLQRKQEACVPSSEVDREGRKTANPHKKASSSDGNPEILSIVLVTLCCCQRLQVLEQLRKEGSCRERTVRCKRRHFFCCKFEATRRTGKGGSFAWSSWEELRIWILYSKMHWKHWIYLHSHQSCDWKPCQNLVFYGTGTKLFLEPSKNAKIWQRQFANCLLIDSIQSQSASKVDMQPSCHESRKRSCQSQKEKAA